MDPMIQHIKTVTRLFVAFALGFFSLLSQVQAISPAPDGGYPGGNTAEGQAALLSRTTGGFNTAVGFLSLSSDTSNSFNTAIGAGALLANTADSNTATGAGALLSNTTGSINTAYGAFALFHNMDGSNNTAIGHDALLSQTTNNSNTAVGSEALSGNASGGGNTAVGVEALAVATGSDNVAVGLEAGLLVSTASGVISIGHSGADVSNSTWISNIYQTTTVSGTTLPVIVSDQGQLGTTPSSRRFKKEVKPMDNASEAILDLKPVTFRYKSDKTNTPQFGLVAEDVEKVSPDLVVCDEAGKPYTVRYDAVNAMLLNEFLKAHKAFVEEHRNVQEQGATIARQQKQIEALTAGLQKVTAQLELKKPAPQTALNSQ